MRSYISFCLFLLFASSSVGAIDLTQPIKSIIPELDNPDSARVFAQELVYPASTAIYMFIEIAFYKVRIQSTYVDKAKSPFFRKHYGWDAVLIERLASHGLALNMSPREIAAYNEGLPLGPLFRPVEDLVVTNEKGRRISSNYLTRRGMYLVKDFVRLYSEEMRLPEDRRFRLDYKDGQDLVRPFKLAVDALLAQDRVENVFDAAPKVGSPVEAMPVRDWLLRTRSTTRVGKVRRACDVLLAEFDSDVDPNQI